MVWLRRALCLALVLVIWASTCSARVTEIVYVADLSADSVYDELSLPAKGTGSALCRFDRRSVPHKVTIEVQHTIPTGAGGLPEITKIGVYRGAPGTPGSPVLFFSSFQGSRSLETFELNVSQQEANLEDFLDGLWFIQIHTVDNPTGEIRGQFLHNKRVYAQMDGSKMVPATRSGNYGLLTGTYSFEQPTDTLNLKIYHTVPNPTDLVVYQGEANSNGKLIVGNELTTSTQSFSIKYAVRERDYLLDDHDYAVIESQSQTLGEIRGQITTIDYIERVDYTARLGSSGDLVGCGLVEYDCVTSFLEFNVHHNLEGNCTTFLVDTTGDSTVIASFSFLSSPSYGRVRLTDAQAANLDAEKIAFVIRSEANDDEINGFISTEFPYWSYISGTNVVPPVTTGASGCATIRLTKSGSTALIDYEIVHSIPNSRAERADINIGAEGYSSNELFEIFTSPDSPIKASEGIEISLTKTTLATFQDEQMYLLVRSPSYPLGEIRGQIKLINPCLRDPIDQMSTKVDETTNYPSSYKFKYSGTLTTPPNTILSSSASLLRSPLSSSSSSLFSFVCALLFFCVAFGAVFTLQ